MAIGFATIEKIIGDTYTDDITAGRRPLWCKHQSPLIYSRRRSDGLTGSIAWESMFISQQRFRWEPGPNYRDKTISEAFSEWGFRNNQDELVKEWIPVEISANGKVEHHAVRRNDFLEQARHCTNCRFDECVQIAITKGLITLALPELRLPLTRIRFHQDTILSAVVNPAGIDLHRAESLKNDLALLIEIGRSIDNLCSAKSAVNSQ